jgi:hypothetical protein
LPILKQPQKTLPGKFVVAYNEETTTGKLLQDWSEVTGKKAAYVQTSLEDFSEIWPGWGMEMGIMMKMWNEPRERSWPTEGVLNKGDLGLLNWSNIIPCINLFLFFCSSALSHLEMKIEQSIYGLHHTNNSHIKP